MFVNEILFESLWFNHVMTMGNDFFNGDFEEVCISLSEGLYKMESIFSLKIYRT